MARPSNTRVDGSPFDEQVIETVWQKATPINGDRLFRKDVYGNGMLWKDYGKHKVFGWEIDHIIPVAKGGTDVLSNLQPLHWKMNQKKGNTYPWPEKEP